MSCEVAALPFQAHANYGTWSIDFGATVLQARIIKKLTLSLRTVCKIETVV